MDRRGFVKPVAAAVSAAGLGCGKTRLKLLFDTHIGVACQMQEGEYNRLLAGERPQTKYIREPMRQWVEHVRQRPGAPIPDYLPRPYDSLTAMALHKERLLTWPPQQ